MTFNIHPVNHQKKKKTNKKNPVISSVNTKDELLGHVSYFSLWTFLQILKSCEMFDIFVYAEWNWMGIKYIHGLLDRLDSFNICFDFTCLLNMLLAVSQFSSFRGRPWSEVIIGHKPPSLWPIMTDGQQVKSHICKINNNKSVGVSNTETSWQLLPWNLLC